MAIWRRSIWVIVVSALTGGCDKELTTAAQDQLTSHGYSVSGAHVAPNGPGYGTRQTKDYCERDPTCPGYADPDPSAPGIFLGTDITEEGWRYDTHG